MTPRLVYLPSPNPICSEPSRAQAMAQTFSVHDRSVWLTVANVSTIWWWKVSSAGTSGPSVLTGENVPVRLRAGRVFGW